MLPGFVNGTSCNVSVWKLHVVSYRYNIIRTLWLNIQHQCITTSSLKFAICESPREQNNKGEIFRGLRKAKGKCPKLQLDTNIVPQQRRQEVKLQPAGGLFRDGFPPNLVPVHSPQAGILGHYQLEGPSLISAPLSLLPICRYCHFCFDFSAYGFWFLDCCDEEVKAVSFGIGDFVFWEIMGLMGFLRIILCDLMVFSLCWNVAIDKGLVVSFS